MTEAQTEAQKYFVRYSNTEDFDKLMRFYKENPHKNVDERNESLMRALVENGSVTLIESAQTGEVVAASISYPLLGEDGLNQKWLEIGTTRSVLNGYPGLFDVMISMQVMRAFLVEPPEERFVCQMESSAVRKMAENLGFRPFTPSAELVLSSDTTLNAGETCGFEKWYSAGPEALPVIAQRLIEAISKPHLTNVKTGEKIEFDFSKSKFFSLFKEEFVELAKRDLGNYDQPDYKASIAKSRQQWMRWYFK